MSALLRQQSAAMASTSRPSQIAAVSVPQGRSARLYASRQTASLALTSGCRLVGAVCFGNLFTDEVC
jgi:hypothetical protein